MRSLIDSLRTGTGLTHNGAVTHTSSLNACLDLFFIIGASRSMPEVDILTAFSRAHAENKALAYKILFWARDCRGGAGERRAFRAIAQWISTHHPHDWDQLVIHVETYGYWKDIFMIGNPNKNMLQYLWTQLHENPNANLLAKWYPRKGPWFTAMHRHLTMKPGELRKFLVNRSKTVETVMCERRWSDINYSAVPSIAMNKYRNAFGKRDMIRFNQFIADALEGKAKINASVLFPHELYRAISNGQDENAVEAQWRALPNYMEGCTERILPMCDVSGSMSGLPMEVSVGLGLYIAERNVGPFKDCFLTFSRTPKLEMVAGHSLAQRMRNLARAEWGMNTDLVSAFTTILEVATRDSLPENVMPTKILVISDMEFDACGSSTNFDYIRAEYEKHGYKLPGIIFWNVNGRLENNPAQVDTRGVGMVSGFSPAILRSVVKGDLLSSHQLMLDTVDTPRYARVTVE